MRHLADIRVSLTCNDAKRFKFEYVTSAIVALGEQQDAQVVSRRTVINYYTYYTRDSTRFYNTLM